MCFEYNLSVMTVGYEDMDGDADQGRSKVGTMKDVKMTWPIEMINSYFLFLQVVKRDVPE